MDMEQLIADEGRKLRTNLNRVIAGLGDREVFGISAIQRLCGISFNNAHYVVEIGKEQGLICVCSINEYQFSLTDKGKELRDKITAI